MSRSNVSDPYDQASRWLGRRDHSEQELRAKLLQAGHSTDIVEATIAKLRTLNFIDDKLVAERWATRRAAQGYGAQRARAELLHRGIAEATVDTALSTSFVDEENAARQILRLRFPGGIESERDRARAAHLLTNRGFSAETLLAIVGEGC